MAIMKIDLPMHVHDKLGLSKEESVKGNLGLLLHLDFARRGSSIAEDRKLDEKIRVLRSIVLEEEVNKLPSSQIIAIMDYALRQENVENIDEAQVKRLSNPPRTVRVKNVITSFLRRSNGRKEALRVPITPSSDSHTDFWKAIASYKVSDMFTMIGYCRDRAATESVGHIYGLLWFDEGNGGVCRSRMRVNYSGEARADHIGLYKQFGKIALENEMRLALLISASSLKRPLGLPSWCPIFASGHMPLAGQGETITHRRSILGYQVVAELILITKEEMKSML